MNRGSEWRQWDLHFHTPTSYDYKDMSVTNQALVDGLVANGISAVAITDHHVIDINRIKELQTLGADKLLVFPGIEFLSDARGKEPVHFIAIFSDKSDIGFIWGQIENKTNISRIKGEGKAVNEIYCDLQDTCKLIHELGGIVTIHAGSRANGIDKITNSLPHYEAQKDDISKLVDIYDMGKEEDLPDYKRNVFPSINRIVPMVICSDNHNIRDYQRKQKLWIKADLSFEGLKQILYEPEERVALCASKPDDKSVYNVIDYVSMSEHGFWENTIYLNQNLNAIIGGRSTGKSSFLNALAAKHNCQTLQEKNYIREHTAFINVVWSDGNCELDREIEFLPQGYMHEIARSSDKTNELVERILRHKDVGGLLDELDTKHQTNKKTITEGLLRLFNLNSDLTKERGDLAGKGAKDGVKQQIDILSAKILELQKNIPLTPEENSNFKGLLGQVSKKKRLVEKANQDVMFFSKLRVITPIRNDFEKEHNLQLLSFELNSYEAARLFKNLRLRTEKEWTAIVDELSKSTNEAKEKLETEIDIIVNSELYKKGLAYYEGNNELKDLSEKIELENRRFAQIEQIENRIQSIRNQISELLDRVLAVHLEFKSAVQNVVDNLIINDEDLVINVQRVFEVDKMKEYFESRLNMRGYSRQEYASAIVNDYEGDTESQTKKFILDLLQGKVDLKSANTPLSVAIDFLSTNWYSLNYELNYQDDSFDKMSEGKQAFVILKLLLEFSDKQCPILIDQPEDSLDNRAIYNELVTYIKKKKKIRQIILVTHNSNVVVSADAENVIVANQNGTDSPNDGNNQFEYINGSLENTMKKDVTNPIVLKSQGIREHVCDILEGGKAAFEKRELKYGFK